MLSYRLLENMMYYFVYEEYKFYKNIFHISKLEIFETLLQNKCVILVSNKYMLYNNKLQIKTIKKVRTLQTLNYLRCKTYLPIKKN